jgi:DNA-binding response OmpR family regulator
MGTATILVVDDERKIRDLVRSYLELEGYSVLVADTGERGLESASRSDPPSSCSTSGSPTSP